MQKLDIFNHGCIIRDIPKDLFKVLQTESQTLETNNEVLSSGLTGGGVTKHYFMREETKPQFFNFIQSLLSDYVREFPGYLSEYRVLSHSCAFGYTNPWYNMQHKGDFTPNHMHEGILSYSAWLKIPYDLEEERKSGIYASCFEFTHSTITGNLGSTILPIDKGWEGKIAMFPARLLHCVYPFHTVDDVRISLSGNILFDTEKARIQ
jgi:hypothetical protein